MSDGFVYPPPATAAVALADGSYGDVVVSGGGLVMTVDADAITTAKVIDDAVTYAKIQDVSATNRLLGRSTAGAGVIEEIVCTAAGRALIDDANAAAQIATLGLSDAATTTVAAIITAVVNHINSNYGDILIALATAVSKGDILAFDGSTWRVKPIEADGRVLTTDSGDPDTGLSWA